MKWESDRFFCLKLKYNDKTQKSKMYIITEKSIVKSVLINITKFVFNLDFDMIRTQLLR